MFDHITITVKNYDLARSFYEIVLAPLGYTSLYEEDGIVTGFGETRPMFWIAQSDKSHPVSANVHLSFSVEDRELVDLFYEQAIKEGGKDNGAPGLRPEYEENYYAAFVIDHDGNNIEALCRTEE
ncbi:MAG: VOC family protein [Patescibacteria group bacterium]